MNPVSFGRRVQVHALTMRVIGYREDEQERFKTPQAGDVPFGFATRSDAWPGEAVALEWDLPKGPRFLLEPSPNGYPVVRYRRLALDQPVAAIVIGSCWRSEGIIDEVNLSGRRTISLYEVALQPSHRSTKALVVFAHPRDIEIIEEQGRGVGPPTGGTHARLGGGR